MRTRRTNTVCERRQHWQSHGSTFVIVLWIAFGLVSLAVYFAHSMIFELRASDNRVCGIAAEQAIEGAARYVGLVLNTYGTNGLMPGTDSYLPEAVTVGDSHFWLIGRDTNNPSGPAQLSFGLVDEASKLNLNYASSNMLEALAESLPRASLDITAAIIDWRSTNSSLLYQTYYATRSMPYQTKASPFETVEETRLLYGADMATLVGEDANRNGILDPNEQDENQNGKVDSGILEYTTVYSREPNTRSNGAPRINISVVSGSTGPLPSLLQSALGQSRSDQILTRLGLISTGPQRGGPGTPPNTGRVVEVILRFVSPLQFYRISGMTADEFALIANDITVTTADFIQGRININTASATVLGCLPGISDNPDLAQTLIDYRQANPDKLGSVAWIVDALGQGNGSVLQSLQAVDCMTTRSFQFSADIAAIGPHGRGYRRQRFVFDTSDGPAKILYRQDLTQLGWALGKEARQNWLFAKDTR